MRKKSISQTSTFTDALQAFPDPIETNTVFQWGKERLGGRVHVSPLARLVRQQEVLKEIVPHKH